MVSAIIHRHSSGPCVCRSLEDGNNITENKYAIALEVAGEALGGCCGVLKSLRAEQQPAQGRIWMWQRESGTIGV